MINVWNVVTGSLSIAVGMLMMKEHQPQQRVADDRNVRPSRRQRIESGR